MYKSMPTRVKSVWYFLRPLCINQHEGFDAVLLECACGSFKLAISRSVKWMKTQSIVFL